MMDASWQPDQGGGTVCGSSEKTEPLLIFINNYRGLCRELWKSFFGNNYDAPFLVVL